MGFKSETLKVNFSAVIPFLVIIMGAFEVLR